MGSKFVRSWVVSVLILTSLFTWTTPSFGMRGIGLEEGSERAKLEKRLLAEGRGNRGNFPRGLQGAGLEEGAEAALRRILFWNFSPGKDGVMRSVLSFDVKKVGGENRIEGTFNQEDEPYLFSVVVKSPSPLRLAKDRKASSDSLERGPIQPEAEILLRRTDKEDLHVPNGLPYQFQIVNPNTNPQQATDWQLLKKVQADPPAPARYSASFNLVPLGLLWEGEGTRELEIQVHPPTQIGLEETIAQALEAFAEGVEPAQIPPKAVTVWDPDVIAAHKEPLLKLGQAMKESPELTARVFAHRFYLVTDDAEIQSAFPPGYVYATFPEVQDGLSRKQVTGTQVLAVGQIYYVAMDNKSAKSPFTGWTGLNTLWVNGYNLSYALGEFRGMVLKRPSHEVFDEARRLAITLTGLEEGAGEARGWEEPVDKKSLLGTRRVFDRFIQSGVPWDDFRQNVDVQEHFKGWSYSLERAIQLFLGRTPEPGERVESEVIDRIRALPRVVEALEAKVGEIGVRSLSELEVGQVTERSSAPDRAFVERAARDLGIDVFTAGLEEKSAGMTRREFLRNMAAAAVAVSVPSLSSPAQPSDVQRPKWLDGLSFTLPPDLSKRKAIEVGEGLAYKSLSAAVEAAKQDSTIEVIKVYPGRYQTAASLPGLFLRKGLSLVAAEPGSAVLYGPTLHLQGENVVTGFRIETTINLSGKVWLAGNRIHGRVVLRGQENVLMGNAILYNPSLLPEPARNFAAVLFQGIPGLLPEGNQISGNLILIAPPEPDKPKATRVAAIEVQKGEGNWISHNTLVHLNGGPTLVVGEWDPVNEFPRSSGAVGTVAEHNVLVTLPPPNVVPPPTLIAIDPLVTRHNLISTGTNLSLDPNDKNEVVSDPGTIFGEGNWRALVEGKKWNLLPSYQLLPARKSPEHHPGAFGFKPVAQPTQPAGLEEKGGFRQKLGDLGGKARNAAARLPVVGPRFQAPAPTEPATQEPIPVAQLPVGRITDPEGVPLDRAADFLREQLTGTQSINFTIPDVMGIPRTVKEGKKSRVEMDYSWWGEWWRKSVSNPQKSTPSQVVNEMTLAFPRAQAAEKFTVGNDGGPFLKPVTHVRVYRSALPKGRYALWVHPVLDETLRPGIQRLIEIASEYGVREIVIGSDERGAPVTEEVTESHVWNWIQAQNSRNFLTLQRDLLRKMGGGSNADFLKILDHAIHAVLVPAAGLEEVGTGEEREIQFQDDPVTWLNVEEAVLAKGTLATLRAALPRNSRGVGAVGLSLRTLEDLKKNPGALTYALLRDFFGPNQGGNLEQLAPHVVDYLVKRDGKESAIYELRRASFTNSRGTRTMLLVIPTFTGLEEGRRITQHTELDRGGWIVDTDTDTLYVVEGHSAAGRPVRARYLSQGTLQPVGNERTFKRDFVSGRFLYLPSRQLKAEVTPREGAVKLSARQGRRLLRGLLPKEDRRHRQIYWISEPEHFRDPESLDVARESIRRIFRKGDYLIVDFRRNIYLIRPKLRPTAEAIVFAQNLGDRFGIPRQGSAKKLLHPTTTGLEETNIRKAIALRSPFSFDFLENISDALIDAAIADGATEFTMNPYSTGNYIQHLVTFSTPEGRSWANRLLTIETQEEWLTFKKEYVNAPAAVSKAIKAAMEPSPAMTPETERALAQQATQSMLSESERVIGMMRELEEQGKTGEDAYWAVTVYLGQKIADRLRSINEQEEGRTGYVSIEVDPRLEWETFANLRAGQEALEVWASRQMQEQAAWLGEMRPNFLVKVPATPAGTDTVEAVKVHFNKTLIFVDDDATDAIEAYERRGDPDHVLRLSPFISRNAVWFQEFWGGWLKEADGHVCTICNTYSTFRAMGPYAQGAIWSSLGMKVKGDPGELYAQQVVGVGILNMPPDTAYAFNQAAFDVVQKFKDGTDEELERIIADYFRAVQAGRIPSARDKFPSLMQGEVTSEEQARRAVAEWRALQDRLVDEARLDQAAQIAGEKRAFTQEAIRQVRARLAAGEKITEKMLMRAILKKEGEEKFIVPFQKAIDLLQKTIDRLRLQRMTAPLREKGLELVELLLSRVPTDRPALSIEDMTGVFYGPTEPVDSPERQVTLEQAGDFLSGEPRTEGAIRTIHYVPADPGTGYPAHIRLQELTTPPNEAYLTAQRGALQAALERQLAQLRQQQEGRSDAGLEEVRGLVLVGGALAVAPEAAVREGNVAGVTVGYPQTKMVLDRELLSPADLAAVANGLEEAAAIASLDSRIRVFNADQFGGSVETAKQAAIRYAQSWIETLRGVLARVVEFTGRTVEAIRAQILQFTASLPKGLRVSVTDDRIQAALDVNRGA